MNEGGYFLPYQIRWYEDPHQIIFWEKSRRIGATYVVAYRATEAMIVDRYNEDTWFSTNDVKGAKEFIRYCVKWAEFLNFGFQDLGVTVIDKENAYTALTVEFANGRRINAMSSNPNAIHGKGGVMILDEAARHRDPEEMWEAAYPVVMWGFPLWALSTHRGKRNFFYETVQDIKKGKLKWGHQFTDIFTAVDEGLLDKIRKRPTSKEEREEWLRELERGTRKPWIWKQQFCVIPEDENTAFMSYTFIKQAAREGLTWLEQGLLIWPRFELSAVDLDKSFRIWPTNYPLDCGDLYVGFDVGRYRNFSVAWVTEKVGLRCTTREVIVLDNKKFNTQRGVLRSIFVHPKFRRACIDRNGIGLNLWEDMNAEFGSIVEGVDFTPKNKEAMASSLFLMMEDGLFLVPDDEAVADDFHLIRKDTSATGNTRFVAEEDEEGGHADRFWAAALSCMAATDASSPAVEIITSGTSAYRKSLRGL